MDSHPESPIPSDAIPCDGWWEEVGFGRQPMRDLWLCFRDGTIQGAGSDIVGPFTFSGVLSGDGQVMMLKQYVGRHAVDYAGQYDGEGTMWGYWRIGYAQDRWMITFRLGAAMDSAHIREYQPTTKERNSYE